MLIKVDNVTYTYAKKKSPSVSGLNFTADEGEVIAVVGRSGCGKSTLGNLVTGVIPGIFTDGQLEGNVLKAKGILVGLVSQTPENQLFGYSTEDAILFGMENLCLERDEVAERLEYVLDLLNIQYLRKRPIEKLSGGQKQSVCIASILALKPKVIVMDEPVSSLDPAGKSLVQSILFRLKETGQSIILLDQNLEWCHKAVTRIVGMEAGRIVFNGSFGDLISDPVLCRSLGVTLPPVTEVCTLLRERGIEVEPTPEWEGDIRELCAGLDFSCIADETLEQSHGGDAFRTESLVHSFGDFQALRGISVSFEAGKVTAILGQNGCGKTTLIKHFNGLLRPTSGRVYFFGEDNKNLSVAQLSERIGFCFQHPDQMLFEDTVEKEITFASRMHKKDLSRENVLALLERYDLADAIDAFPSNLSMGQKHMVSILACAATEADVYIFDEPTLGMDSVLKQYLLRLIRELRAKEKTVLIISHELAFVCEVADRAVIMKEGLLLESGECADIFADPDLFEQTRIPLPQIRRVANELGLPKRILTSEQLAEAIAACIRKGAAV